MKSQVSFAFSMSAREAAEWKENLSKVHALPRPASGSTRELQIGTNKAHIAYYDKDQQKIMSYHGEKSHLSDDWFIVFEGKRDDFGYGDVGLLHMPYKKLSMLRQFAN